MNEIMIREAMQSFTKNTGLSGDFFVERVFIRYYAKEGNATGISISQPEIGFADIDIARSEYEFVPQERLALSVIVSFTAEHAKVDYLRITYWDFADNRGLLITDPESSTLYRRRSDQDHKTEWEINVLAGIATDENGDIIFKGEPVNI